jgi:phage terminase large subunit-like protein
MSKEVQKMYLEAGGLFRGGKRKADIGSWRSDSNGIFTAVGTGTALTGKGGDILILDDPIKDAEEALSPVVQASKLNWFGSTFMTRANPSIGKKKKFPAVVIIVMTLWSPNDIPIRLMEAERALIKAGEDKKLLTPWTVLNFSAIKEANTLQIPDHFNVIHDDRRDGEALCPDMWDIEFLEKVRAGYKALGTEWMWESLYQQRPVPAAGIFIQRNWIRDARRDQIPKLVRWFRAWDLAFTKDGGDRTVSALCGIDNQRNIWVIPDVSVQCSPADVTDIIRQTALRDPEGTVYGIERAHAGLAIIDELKREGPLSGRNIHESVPRKNKPARAANWIAKAKAGKIYVVADSIPSQLIAEELKFSWTTFRGQDGDFDDWVDMMSIIDEMVSQTYGDEKQEDLPALPIEYVSGINHGKTNPRYKKRRDRSGDNSEWPTVVIPDNPRKDNAFDGRDEPSDEYKRELAELRADITSRILRREPEHSGRAKRESRLRPHRKRF